MITHIIKTKCPACNNQSVYMPYYKKDYEKFSKRRSNIVLECDIKQPRGRDHHRLIFGLAHVCLENMKDGSFWGNYYLSNPDNSEKNFIKAIMLDAGLFDLVPNIDGTWRKEAKSISFSNMDEIEFQYVSNAIFRVVSEILELDLDWLREGKNYESVFRDSGL